MFSFHAFEFESLFFVVLICTERQTYMHTDRRTERQSNTIILFSKCQKVALWALLRYVFVPTTIERDKVRI